MGANMKMNRKIQILAILAILAFLLVVIGVSAYSSANTEPQYQEDNLCPNKDDCPQPYCNYQHKSNWNCQPRSCCGWRE